jgi:prepilin-type N-terminal cleavage/methylation domain-containing protein
MANTPAGASHRWSSLLAAFTLIELLAVIAIIAVLAAFAFPAIGSVMAKAQSAKGVSNLRQIGQLVANYAADNNNRLPAQIDWSNMGGNPANFRFFQNYLRLNAGLATVGNEFFASPWLPAIFYDPTLQSAPQHPWGSFGVNDEIIVDAWLQRQIRATQRNPPCCDQPTIAQGDCLQRPGRPEFLLEEQLVFLRDGVGQ